MSRIAEEMTCQSAEAALSDIDSRTGLIHDKLLHFIYVQQDIGVNMFYATAGVRIRPCVTAHEEACIHRIH